MNEHDDHHRSSDRLAETRRRRAGSHGAPTVTLTDEERRRFAALTRDLAAPDPGRRRSRPTWRPWMSGAAIAAGVIVMIAGLGRAPVVVPFGGFLLMLTGGIDLSRSGSMSAGWRRTRAALGFGR